MIFKPIDLKIFRLLFFKKGDIIYLYKNKEKAYV